MYKASTTHNLCIIRSLHFACVSFILFLLFFICSSSPRLFPFSLFFFTSTAFPHFFFLLVFLLVFIICLGYRTDCIMWRSHLREHFIEPLQWPMQVYFNPARCRCNILTMIFSTPTLDKGHAYCTHFCELIDSFESTVDRL